MIFSLIDNLPKRTSIVLPHKIENLPEFFEDGGQCRYADDNNSNQWYFAIKEDFVKKNICESSVIQIASKRIKTAQYGL